MTEIEQLEQAIAALESQRELLGDLVVETALAPMRTRLAQLNAQRPGVEQQRKQVTVLFADVSGFTALSETLDSEEVTEIINALWQRLDGAIQQHGGTIDKHIGDAVMALWSADAGREDDPERCIRAALAMQAEIGTFAQTLPHLLQMRMGVNTGPVLLSSVGTVGEFTAMGDTVNLASRLEQAAPIGGILISHDTYRHVRGIFDIQALEPLVLKGKAEPIRAYLVESARPRSLRGSPRGVEGVEARTIGRAAELDQLQQAFLASSDQARTGLALVIGDAGIGKSRLLHEMETWLDSLPTPIWYFKGHASPQTTNLPLALLRDMLAFRFEIMESDSLALVREKLEQGVASFLGPDSVARAHILGAWLGYDFAGSPHLQGIREDSRRLHDHALAHLGELFAAVTATTPAVVLLEDLHWADEQSLNALLDLVRAQPNLRLFVLAVARRRFFERHPNWGTDAPTLLHINLGRLSPQDTRTLVGQILQKVEHIPEALVQLIIERAEGMPFYIEELIKMLIDDAVILPGEQSWSVALDRLDHQRIPTTLTGVLQARLDGLQLSEKLALQRASVVGRVFWEAAVRCVTGAGQPVPDEQLELALAGLHHRELVFPRAQSTFAETSEYIFKHALLRDVAYESVLKRERRIYHAQVAQWLEQAASRSERADEYAALIAAHYYQADKLKQAMEWYQRAGEQAQLLYTPRSAVEHFSRALEVAQQRSDPARLALQRARGLAYETLGEFEKARQDHEAALALARQSDDQRVETQALLDLGALWAGRDYNQTGDYYRQALEVTRTIGDPALLAQSLNRMGNWYINNDQPARSKQHHLEALAIFRRLGHQRGIAATLDLLGIMSSITGDGQHAMRYYQEATELFRLLDERHGLIGGLASSLRLLPFHQYEAMILPPVDRAEVLRRAEEALALARETGWRSGEAFVKFMLGGVLGTSGDYARGLRLAQECLAIALEIEHRQWTTAAHVTLGTIYASMFALPQALEHLQLGLELARQIKSHFWVNQASGRLALFYLQHGDPEQATSTLSQSYIDLRSQPQSNPQRLLWFVNAEIMLATGAPDRALVLAEQVLESLPNRTAQAVVPALWRLRADALSALGRVEEAEPLLRAAVDQLRAHAHRPLLWQLYLRQTALYLGQQRQAEAHRTLEQARLVVDELSGEIHDQRLREQFLSHAYARFPTV